MRTLEEITEIIINADESIIDRANEIEEMYFDGKEKTANRLMQKLCGLTIDEWIMWAAN